MAALTRVSCISKLEQRRQKELSFGILGKYFFAEPSCPLRIVEIDYWKYQNRAGKERWSSTVWCSLYYDVAKMKYKSLVMHILHNSAQQELFSNNAFFLIAEEAELSSFEL